MSHISIQMKSIQVKNRLEWRDWLKKNHTTEKEIWLLYYKTHTGKPTIMYKESVEEAICFGWIDGLKKRIDDEKYAHRFTIRKARSKWSPLNISIAKRMIKEKKMTDFGLSYYKQRIEYDKEFIKSCVSDEIRLSSEIEQEFRRNEKAWNNFLKLSPSNKNQYSRWIMSAKKEITKLKRLKEAIELLKQNRKLGMK